MPSEETRTVGGRLRGCVTTCRDLADSETQFQLRRIRDRWHVFVASCRRFKQAIKERPRA